METGYLLRQLELCMVVLIMCYFHNSDEFLMDSGIETTSRCPITVAHGKYLHVFRDRCFEFVIYNRKYWSDARHDCQEKGGDLVVIPDADTQNFVMTTLRNLGNQHDGIWLGLTDLRHELHWEWINGEPLTGYNNWAHRQGGANALHYTQDCAQIRTDDHGLWHDRECHLWPNRFSFICEFEMIPIPPTTTSKSTSTSVPTTTTAKSTSTTVPTTTTAKSTSTTAPTTSAAKSTSSTVPTTSTAKSTSTTVPTKTSAKSSPTSVPTTTATTATSTRTTSSSATLSETTIQMSTAQTTEVISKVAPIITTTMQMFHTTTPKVTRSSNGPDNNTTLTTRPNTPLTSLKSAESSTLLAILASTQTLSSDPPTTQHADTRTMFSINRTVLSHTMTDRTVSSTSATEVKSETPEVYSSSGSLHSASFPFLSSTLPVKVSSTTTKHECTFVDCDTRCPHGYSGLYVGSDGCVECSCL